MFTENLKLFFKFYVRPLSALSDSIDRGNLIVAGLLATGVAFLMAFTVTNRLYESYEAVPIPAEERLPKELRVPPQVQGDPEAEEAFRDAVEEYEARAPRTKQLPLPLIGQRGWRLVSFNPTSMFATAFSLAALYVPAAILALVLIVRNASFRVAFQRDYGSLLICTLMAWGASHLPFGLIGAAFAKTGASANTFLLLWLLASLYFGALMIGALRTACGAAVKHAALAVSLVWVVLRADSWLYSLATWSPYLTLIWVLPLALGAVYGVRASHIQRQSFRRYLDSCTINPRDAEAHYQLGLLYQQRRQYAEAAARFKRAVEVDPREPDANYEMGRLSREQGRLQEAINHFSVVLAHDDKFRQSEIWREVGATYLAAGMHDEALNALRKYIERRPYDPEGLYHLGATLQNLGQTNEARESFQQCLEAVKTMPYYRRNEVRKWNRLAQAKLKREL
ncbi:MAG TPA: tetratricopeptide repeat protein [Blastocatellia bacterium]|nr:tetratricopeptide repeat protein [Blastocatellia bacterium]HMV85893.1 tetratricopeptide repeat protein [Blastocatellia bacterium]HMY72689.1 tetratricopeptide repeat protein [Blastocatellia bacterium]HMZ22024.1 tetratricopeptide repeat protein [Blastocatellia bacterium]HNG31603.1 tetratricopeptide repeat protein [Blastocatellia bacterium]